MKENTYYFMKHAKKLLCLTLILTILFGIMPSVMATYGGSEVIEIFYDEALIHEQDFVFDEASRALNVVRMQPIITVPYHNQIVPHANLSVRWNAVPGATTYILSLRNLNTNALVINNRNLGNVTRFAVSQAQLVPGHQYRVTVASRVGGVDRWTERIFRVQARAARLTIIPTTNWTPTALAGQQRTVNVMSDTSWTITHPAWININRTSGTGNGSFTLTTTANGGLLRSGTVIVSGEGIRRGFTVTQASFPNLTINPTSNWTPSAGGSRSATL